MYANIKEAFHRGNSVKGIFEVHKPFNNGKMGIKAAVGLFGNTVPTPRIQVSDDAFEYCNKDGSELDLSKLISTNPLAKIAKDLTPAVDYEQEFITHESESDAMDRIQHTFQMLETVAEAAVAGTVRGIIIYGPPGVGKSYGVELVLGRSETANALCDKEPDFTIVKGATSAIGLYQILYNYRHKHNTIMFDDCDNVLFDETSLNVLKAALDSKAQRRICWNTESRVLREEDIPKHFTFNGSIIFLTNINFENTRASKIADHLKAIMSRVHYLDLSINNQRDLLLRVKQIVNDGMLKSYNFTNSQEKEIVDYMCDNADYLREISLRMCTKISDIVSMQPIGWQEFVEATCLKPEARYKRMRQAQLDDPIRQHKLPA